MRKPAIRGDAGQIASTAEDSANSRLLCTLWRFLSEVVGATGFEPATPCAQGRCATRLRYAPTATILQVLVRMHRLRIADFRGNCRRKLQSDSEICNSARAL